MIKYNLNCEQEHEFESWFSDSKEFEKLIKKNLVECIYCKSKKIEKSIMSPKVSRLNSKKNFASVDQNELKTIKKDLIKIRKFVEKNFRYVGSNFFKEVKEVHFNNKKSNNIYGVTTEDQRKELSEEGIELTTIPWLKKDN
tara:strand:- start:253 stop:675 length:423 start_codon:yes stop_codon:yes gene_type:complete